MPEVLTFANASAAPTAPNPSKAARPIAVPADMSGLAILVTCTTCLITLAIILLAGTLGL